MGPLLVFYVTPSHIVAQNDLTSKVFLISGVAKPLLWGRVITRFSFFEDLMVPYTAIFVRYI